MAYFYQSKIKIDEEVFNRNDKRIVDTTESANNEGSF